MQFYYSNNITDNIITLDSIESKHCLKVMRYDEGKEINVVDGLGNLFISKIKNKARQSCELTIIKKFKEFGKRLNYLHIAVSPLKARDRMEWLVEKAVEIGVDEISFVCCKHSEKKSINLERLKKISISAMKQSQKAYLPKINELTFFTDFVSSCGNKNKLLAHMDEGKVSPISELRNSKETCIIIGPEGDFSDNEITISMENNFKPVSLGRYRLRSETAAVVACTLLNNG
tara:strand:- start:136 stop:828 length:693 start_codon:yes stop_codon:yes gene_type:complete